MDNMNSPLRLYSEDRLLRQATACRTRMEAIAGTRHSAVETAELIAERSLLMGEYLRRQRRANFLRTEGRLSAR